ncbi:MAG: septum formation inhibitor Maf [Gammaproteobacteria bacterium]|jgi:septum formation protein|nr:septum formation inhibitor Maf [Gammaproteobacteria bacterium]MBT7308909.1 septum formation inhibitor Maf [Gammaproteobacteria bacterium]
MEPLPQIILASASPRRAELLSQIGIRYRIEVADINETVADSELPQVAVSRLATEKAERVWRQYGVSEEPPLPVLGADTIVVNHGKVLQKPTSREAAIEMLSQLSGKVHEVMSAVSVVCDRGIHRCLSSSQVTFREISEVECLNYWATGEPADKAGGYAIQGVGAIFVKQLEGSYSGVMGLPLFETIQLLNKVGVKVL